MAHKPIGWPGKSGLGLAPLVVAAPAAGPAAPIVAAIGVVGSLVSGLKKIFGGVDDQATSYRPPSDSAQRSVQVKGQMIAFDMSNLAEAQRRGNRIDDIYSYYSVFERDNLSGASDAAKRVVQDAASKYTFGNLRDAAITLLDLAGVRKIITPVQMAPAQAQSFTQTTQTQTKTESPVVLPTITTIFGDILDFLKGSPNPPIPDYRPIPVDMTPPSAPGQTAQGAQQTNTAQAAAQKALILAAQKAAQALLKAKQKVASDAEQFGCDPRAQYYDPANNTCVFLAQCPEGQYFEPSLNACAIPESGEDLTGFLDSLGTIGGIPVWLLILLGFVIVMRSGNGNTVTFRRRR